MVNIEETLTPLRKQHTRLLALDIGDRRIGVSVCDTTWMIASPVTMLDRQQDWKKAFLQIFKHFLVPATPQETAIVAVIVGLPLLLNGDEGPSALKVRTFIDKHLTPLLASLKTPSPLPVLLWDERLSTHGANRALMEADMSRDKRKQTIDKMAAVFILQGVLDRLRHANSKRDED